MKSLFSVFVFVLSILATPSFADLSDLPDDAWQCTKSSANSLYKLGTDGIKTAGVLVSAPDCVALAASGDVALYTITGALFTLNAIDSSLISKTNCKQSVQTIALKPLAELLSSILGESIPSHLLTAETTNALWDHLKSSPTFGPVIARIDCGCTFLEAGVNIDKFLEVANTFARIGEACDSAFGHIPGYKTIKEGVEDSTHAMHDVLEDIFTDQAPHKSVEDYYLHDFGGWPLGYELQSHATAAVLNPSHNWRTTSGAGYYSQTYVKANVGAASGHYRKESCKIYFSGHKMSDANADKVCEAMVVRFENEYRARINLLIQRDELVRNSNTELDKILEKAVGQCAAHFPVGDLEPKNALGQFNYSSSSTAEAFTYNDCVKKLVGMRGRFEWSNPYNQVGSLGDYRDPGTIKKELSSYQLKYFQKPLATYGMAKVAWDGFENNGSQATTGVNLAITAYQLYITTLLSDLDILYKKRKENAEAIALNKLQTELAGADKLCPTDATAYKECMSVLEQATVQCLIQKSKVISGDFPNPNTEEKAIFNELVLKCRKDYSDLAKLLRSRYDHIEYLKKSLPACPTETGLKINCTKESEQLIASCMGGTPFMTEGYFINQTFAQNPTPQGSCPAAKELFVKKWGLDDHWINQVNATYSSAATDCINKTPDSVLCQQKLGAQADKCRELIISNSNSLLANTNILSSELDAAMEKVNQISKKCITKMQLIPQKMGQGKEAETLMLSTYENQCERDRECIEDLKTKFAECRGLKPRPSNTRTTSLNLTKAISLRDNLAKVKSMSLMEIKYMDLQSMGLSPDELIIKSPEETVESCKSELDGVISDYKSNRHNRLRDQIRLKTPTAESIDRNNIGASPETIKEASSSSAHKRAESIDPNNIGISPGTLKAASSSSAHKRADQ